MRTTLVFSPFAASSIPLGIANLKSYVEANSSHKVRCVDLNNIANNGLVDSVESGEIQFDSEEDIASSFAELFAIFRGQSDEFYDQARFHEAAKLVRSVLKGTQSAVSDECGLMLTGKADVRPYILEYCNILLDENPDVIGFSIMFEGQYLMALLMARVIKHLNSDIRIVFGSHYPSDEEVTKTVLKSGFVDYVIRKEGEQALVTLLDTLENNGELENVPGLAYLVEGKITTTDTAPPLDLTDVPYADFSDFDLNSYFTPAPVAPIMTSRGCYWRRCTFCNHWSLFGKSYKIPSVERVVDEIEHHVRNGIRHFDIVDEMVAPSRFRKIGEEIIRRGLDIDYFALAMPTKNFDPPTLEIMARSGCRYLLWGFESGAQRILDLIQKGTVIDDVSVVLKNSSAAGIRNHLFTIVGFPTETPADLNKTIDFLYDNRDYIDMVMSGPFVLTKDAHVYSHLDDYQITNVSDRFGRVVDFEIGSGIDSRLAQELADYYSREYFERFARFTYMHMFFRQHTLVHYANWDKLRFTKEFSPVSKPCNAVEFAAAAAE